MKDEDKKDKRWTRKWEKLLKTKVILLEINKDIQ